MKKIIMISIFISSILLLIGCGLNKTTDINILATTDLHGNLPYELSSFVENEKSKDKNTILVDAGDFFSIGKVGLEMNKYFDERYSNDKYNYEYLEVPIAKEMKEIGYDAVILGNHEFIENNKFQLDNMIYDFKRQDIEVLSANIYKYNGENYVKPYLIKDIITDEGNIKLGILGLTIQEVGQTYEKLENGEVKATSEGLSDLKGYDSSLHMNDLVEDAKKYVQEMKANNTDIIIAVVHSGECNEEIKYPGNRIQDLAKNVDGIDVIVAGHTHKEINQHNYKNKNGENVIVTQPGKYGEHISKINLKMGKNNGKWNIIDKSSGLIKFKKSNIDKNTENFRDSVLKNIIEKKGLDKVSLNEITPFEWDKAYVFEPNTPPEKIYEIIGHKWQDIRPIENEDMIQMIFMQNNEVTCYLFGYEKYLQIDFKFYKSQYNDNVIIIYPKGNDTFQVRVDSKWKIAYFNHV